MAFLKSQATEELREAVAAVEGRADDCWKEMRLLMQPRNLATWALLTRMAIDLELVQQNAGADSQRLRDAFTFWDVCTIGFVFIAARGKPESKLVRTYTWTKMLGADSASDWRLCQEYTHFQNLFPLWHRDRQAAEVLPDGRVRFAFERESPAQRRVVAFQQTFRPQIGMKDASTRHRMKLNTEQERLFAELRQSAESRGSSKKLKYEAPAQLIDAVRDHFSEALDHISRYPDSQELEGYSLAEFRAFFAGLLALCGIHERICCPYLGTGHAIPESSMVMVKSRPSWIAELARASGLGQDICSRIISHLTLDPTPGKAISMVLYPFVPLDKANWELAVAPQFPLAARFDDNVLRAFSYRSPAQFSRANTQKEEILRGRIIEANRRFNIPDSVRLPDKSTDLDLIVEDSESSTLVLAELKWVRKPVKPGEREARDAEIEKGIHQIHTVRDYALGHPEFLKSSRRLNKSIDSYAHVHYLLIAADHWFWVEREYGFAILDFQVFLTQFAESADLHATISELLTYSWLPVEGVDFRVGFAPSWVNGVVIESPTIFRIR
ncbi:MAG: hypothetical protein ACLQG3_09800 [Terracidiphilus sp.]